MEAGRRAAGGPRRLRSERAAIWLEADGPARRRRSPLSGSPEESEASWGLCVWFGMLQTTARVDFRWPSKRRDVTSNSPATRLGHLSQGATFSMRMKTAIAAAPGGAA